MTCDLTLKGHLAPFFSDHVRQALGERGSLLRPRRRFVLHPAEGPDAGVGSVGSRRIHPSSVVCGGEDVKMVVGTLSPLPVISTTRGNEGAVVVPAEAHGSLRVDLTNKSKRTALGHRAVFRASHEPHGVTRGRGHFGIRNFEGGT